MGQVWCDAMWNKLSLAHFSSTSSLLSLCFTAAKIPGRDTLDIDQTFCFLSPTLSCSPSFSLNCGTINGLVWLSQLRTYVVAKNFSLGCGRCRQKKYEK